MEFFIKRFNQVKRLHDVVSRSKMFTNTEVKIADAFGSAANARSLLGMMALNYNKPIKIICENNELTCYLIKVLEAC